MKNQQRRYARILHLALVLAVLAVPAGCSRSRPAQPASAPPSSGPARSVLSSDASSLLDKWYRNEAEQLLIKQCMAHLGFVYTVPEMGPAPEPNTVTAFALGNGDAPTYGVTPDSVTNTPPTDPGSDQPRYALALDGPASATGTMSFAGGGSVSFETGGCQGEARVQLYGSVALSMASAYLPQIQGNAFSGYLNRDQAYLTALHAWRACMKADGLSVADPDSAANYFLQLAGNTSAADLARRQEAMAAADIACDGKAHLRQRTNEALGKFVGTLAPQILTQLDAVASSRAKADQMARRIVS